MSDSSDDIFAASGVAAPAAPIEESSKTPYRVLARKYRPQNFAQLIGQSAMIQTLGNAIKRDRLAHAFLMTGVRGVGKTSTARLIAKALNCIGPDSEGGPTIDPCGQCEPCIAIAEGRHIDVIEMDAASHTGVDDVREIIEAVRYASVSARFKIYIIDEVHMLSKNAFNALLKTLEEPPAHVKFLFATTEVDKVPITVLSRCQRFDLKRISQTLLAQHFTEICSKENVNAEPEAIAMIARAADGSVRDGLSVLDQAIAHADMEAEGSVPNVCSSAVRDMLGLSDRTSVEALLNHVVAGEDQEMLALLDRQHALGVEPLAQLRALMDLVHDITLIKVRMKSAKTNLDISTDDMSKHDVASKMSHGNLHRLWQMLLKGHEETAAAPDPREALDMAMLRLVYAASLPDPQKLARLIEQADAPGKGASADTITTSNAPRAALAHKPADAFAQAPSERSVDVPSIEELIQKVDDLGELRTAQIMRDHMRVINVATGELEYELARATGDDFEAALRSVLRRITGQNWVVTQHAMGVNSAQPSITEQEEKFAQQQRAAIMETPLVKAVLQAFPGAKIDDDNVADDTAMRSVQK